MKDKEQEEKLRYLTSSFNASPRQPPREVEFIDPKIDAQRMLERQRAHEEIVKMSDKAQQLKFERENLMESFLKNKSGTKRGFEKSIDPSFINTSVLIKSMPKHL